MIEVPISTFADRYDRYQRKIRELLYFTRNTCSRVLEVVLGITYIYIKFMYLSMKLTKFGNGFISLLQLGNAPMRAQSPLREINMEEKA